MYNIMSRKFETYELLEAAYEKEQVHPGDLKPCLAKYLNVILEPVRKHFLQEGPKKVGCLYCFYVF